MTKATRAIQAWPSLVSGSTPRGRRRRTESGSAGQWAKRRCSHRWLTIHRPANMASLVTRFNHMTKKSSTRDHIVETTLQALAEDGFAGATSRAIARRGKFNQALVYYYFGSLDALLLAALDRTSAERLARYRAAVETAATLEE